MNLKLQARVDVHSIFRIMFVSRVSIDQDIITATDTRLLEQHTSCYGDLYWHYCRYLKL